MSTVLGLLTARGGSKGIPRKNIRLVGGKPLIAWSIEAALASRRVARTIISTDDEEIAQIACQWGAQAPFLRPAELAQDASPHLAVVRHALDWLAENEGYHPDYILLLQPTSPFRTSADIDAAIEIAQSHDAEAVVGVTPTHHHPLLTKTIRPDGTLENFMTSDLAYLRRQDLPAAYAINGAIYLNRPAALLRDGTFSPSGAYAYVMPPERSLDIDTEWDLYLANLILSERQRHASK